MTRHAPQILGFLFFASELLLTISRRSRGEGGVRQDRSTLRTLWIVILASVAAGVFVATGLHAGALPHREFFVAAGLTLFVPGLVLRWWAIVQLGRFFTVDVTIARDHELVEVAPFSVVRHPSYAGVLLAFTGFALSLANWLAFFVLVVPIFAAFVRRMNVEEEALSDALGERYVGYMRRTKRLVPFVY